MLEDFCQQLRLEEHIQSKRSYRHRQCCLRQVDTHGATRARRVGTGRGETTQPTRRRMCQNGGSTGEVDVGTRYLQIIPSLLAQSDMEKFLLDRTPFFRHQHQDSGGQMPPLTTESCGEAQVVLARVQLRLGMLINTTLQACCQAFSCTGTHSCLVSTTLFLRVSFLFNQRFMIGHDFSAV